MKLEIKKKAEISPLLPVQKQTFVDLTMDYDSKLELNPPNNECLKAHETDLGSDGQGTSYVTTMTSGQTYHDQKIDELPCDEQASSMDTMKFSSVKGKETGGGCTS